MGHRPVHILLVEDNRGDARLIREMLAEAGAARFELTQAGRLDEALKCLDRASVDVVLLDLGLPDSQGLDSFSRLHREAPEAPVLVLTGLDDEELATKAVRAGAQDYLVKGQLDGHLVARAIRYAIERQRVEVALSRKARVDAALAELSRALVEPQSIEDVCSLVLSCARRLTGSVIGYAGYIDPDTGFLVCPTLTRDIWEACQVPDKHIVFETFGGLWGWVLENRKAILTNRPADDPRSSGVPQGHLPIHRFLSVPAVIGETLVGQIAVANSRRDYAEQDLPMLERLAALLALAIQRHRADESLRQAHDHLEDRVAERTAELTEANERLEGEVAERTRAEEALRLDEARLEALITLNELAEAPLHQIADFALEEAVKLTKSKIGFLGFVSDDESAVNIHAWSQSAMQECAVVDKPMVFQMKEAGLWGEAVRRREPIVVNDYAASAPAKRGYPAGHVPVSRFLAIPVFDRELIVAVAAVANKEAEYQAGDVRQLTLLMGGMWRLLQRTKAERALRESRGFLQTVIDGIPEPLLVIDRDYRVVLANRTTRELAGGKDPVSSCLTCYQVSHARQSPCQGAEHPCPLEEVIARKAPVVTTHIHCDSDGNERVVEVVAAPIFDGTGEVVQVIESCRDVTESRRLEREILEIGRREQRRIGQDLHDAVGQHLTGVAFLAKVLEKRLSERALPEAANASQIAKTINETIIQARGLARGLCPVDLSADGLMAALQEHAANVEGLFGVRCNFLCDEPVLVHDDEVAMHLYRIAQEAVNNAVKHGKARTIEIAMAANGGHPTLTVKDDGVGLPDDSEHSEGMGLRIMNYRARMIGATFDVRRGSHGGTVVVCSFQPDTVMGR